MMLDKKLIRKFVQAALKEDFARQDATSRALFAPRDRVKGVVLFKGSRGIACGLAFAEEAFKSMDPRARVRFHVREGAEIKKGGCLLSVEGRAAALLSAERTALNFLCLLTGIATKTHEFVRARGGRKRPMISDTRKTHPLLRGAEKYAVKIGGGFPHRGDLAQMAMIKDNHLIALKKRRGFLWGEALVHAVDRLKRRGMAVEIEAQSLADVQAALAVRPDWIMLDNMPQPELKKAVKLIRKQAPQVKIEVSGGVGLKDVRRLSRLDIDRISSGAIVHSAPFANMSLELIA
ncbi:MAG: carboxylating nicotinate-nucleotide diphosphorylase [Elusimicrobia bacterium]|nr:carboxylating nicotinate-nucleotide diphosphorylase [Elusimicrobiota bacterium]